MGYGVMLLFSCGVMFNFFLLFFFWDVSPVAGPGGSSRVSLGRLSQVLNTSKDVRVPRLLYALQDWHPSPASRY